MAFLPLAGTVNWHFIQTGLSRNMLFISGIQNTPTLANPFRCFIFSVISNTDLHGSDKSMSSSHTVAVGLGLVAS